MSGCLVEHKPTGRAKQIIKIADLSRLSKIARADRERFFRAHPRYSAYLNRIACVALCQGAALHFIDRNTGVKDFDVWTFYYELRSVQFPYRRRI